MTTIPLSAAQASAPGEVAGRALFPLTLATLVVCLCFGGGAARGLPSDHAPQLFALPLLFVALRGGAFSAGRGALAFFAFSALLLGALHLAPLPPLIWGALPGRAPLLDLLAVAGEPAPWLPLAMRPDEAMRALLALVPPVALALACLRLDLERRLWLVAVIVAFAALNVVVGLLQTIGLGGAFYFYAFTNPGRSVGFFANVNHAAACLYAAIPLAGALLDEGRLRGPASGWVVLAGVVTLFILGLSVTGSRSALILGVAATAGTLGLVLRAPLAELRASRGARWLAWGAAGLLLLPVALGLGLSRILTRFDAQDVLEDARWGLLPTAFRALSASFPAGVGAGGFETLFQLHETASDLNMPVVNHAHNDWLELVVEFGAPGLALALVALAWVVKRVLRVLRAGGAPEGAETRLARAAGLVILLLALHSAWDYPLRTIALASVLAVCASLLTPAPAGSGPGWRLWTWPAAFRRGEGRRRHRSRRRRRTDAEAARARNAQAMTPEASV